MLRAVVLGLALGVGCMAEPEPADFVFVGGPVYTRDAARPWAEALAVRGESIVYVGSGDDVERFTGSATRIVDLDGRLLLPRIDPDAVVAVHEAVTGRSLRGRQLGAERVPVESAIADHTTGSLVAGSPADLTVLQENILKIPAERIAEAKVEMTVVRGRVAYAARTFDPDFGTTLQ